MTDIERSDGADDGKALRKMLMIVLKKQISGQRLCDALRENVVDEAVLAQNLEVNLPRSVISKRLQTTNFITRGIMQWFVTHLEHRCKYGKAKLLHNHYTL